MLKSRFRSSLLFISIVILSGSLKASIQESKTGWSQVPSILSRIKAPTFPDRDFKITDYGAIAGGQNDSTEAIRKAIAACHNAGGGRVAVPPGIVMTGAIHLKSKVHLHRAEGATPKLAPPPA